MTNTITMYEVIVGNGNERVSRREFSTNEIEKALDYRLNAINNGYKSCISKVVIDVDTRETTKTRMY